MACSGCKEKGVARSPFHREKVASPVGNECYLQWSKLAQRSTMKKEFDNCKAVVCLKLVRTQL